MKKLVLVSMLVLATGCGGGVSKLTSTSKGSGITIPVWTPAAQVISNQVWLSGISPASPTINTVFGSNITLNFTVNDPLNQSRCYWIQTIPVQAGYPTPVVTTFGNSLCTSQAYNQTGSVSTNWELVVSNGQTIATYEWDFVWQSSLPPPTVTASPVNTAAGNVLVYNTKTFQVSTTDSNGAGTCSWTKDAVQVSTDCVSYNYTQADSSSHAIVFTMTDGSSNASVSWTAKPAAQLASVTPAQANVATGGSQLYTAVVTDPHASGYLCEWLLDNSLAQSRGACSYNYVRQDGLPHVISIDVVYDSLGTVRNGAPATVYADPTLLQPVSITGVSPAAGNATYYYTVGQTTAMFGVTTYSDPSGGAWFVWYINGVVVNCDTDPRCIYTNESLKNGIEIANYDGAHDNVQVVLTNGQYSASSSWQVNTPTDAINETVSPGTICHSAGTTFTVFGSGFESTDAFTLQNQNLALTVRVLTPTYVQLQLPAGVAAGLQGVKVIKANSNSYTTSLSWMTLNGGC